MTACERLLIDERPRGYPLLTTLALVVTTIAASVAAVAVVAVVVVMLLVCVAAAGAVAITCYATRPGGRLAGAGVANQRRTAMRVLNVAPERLSLPG